MTLRSKVKLGFICCLLAIAFASSVVAAPPMSQIQRIKFVNNNHIPKKVLVVHSYHNGKFVKDLFNVIKDINESSQLSGSEIVKLHIIPSGGNTISQLGISKADAEKYVEINSQFSSSDIWMQDCMELCSAVTKAGEIIPAVFDSKRGRGLGRLPKTLSQMWDLVYFENPANYQSHGDYGGNLEVTPFDDILVAGDTITEPCKKYLEDLGYKNRLFTGATKWLQVGHIDEYISFIPTAWAPGGYTIVKADPNYALEMLMNIPDSELDKVSHYDRSFLLRVKRLLNKQMDDPYAGRGSEEYDFITLNRTIADIIEDSVGKLKEFIRKTSKEPYRDFEEVAWPSLFEGSNPTNPRRCHAFLPGVVNLLVVRDNLIVPACHIPAFDKAIEAKLRAQGNKVYFVDDTPYHNSMGEIHCGTNALRDLNRKIVSRKQVEAVRAVKEKFKSIHRQ